MDRVKIGRLLLVVPLLAAGIALSTPSPAAAAYACTGTVNGGTIKESVVVPADAFCQLLGTVVRGGVTVVAGGEFWSFGSEIRGSVVADRPYSFVLNGGVVRGSVRVAGAVSLVQLASVEVRGNAAVVDSATPQTPGILDSVVRGSLTFSRNLGYDGAVVSGNTVDVDLVCEGNTPAPIAWDPNTVGGAKLGQCAGL